MSVQSDLLELKTLIRQMPANDQRIIKNIAHSIRTLLFLYGDKGAIAVSLVAGEMAVKEEGTT